MEFPLLIYWIVFLISCSYCSYGLYHTIIKKNPYGLFYPGYLLGIFVYSDALVLGFFWSMASMIFLLNQFPLLFFFRLLCLFWIVRSLGEILYWIHEQFTPHHRNKPHTLFFHSLFPHESIYIAYQLFWQGILIGALFFLIHSFFRSY